MAVRKVKPKAKVKRKVSTSKTKKLRKPVKRKTVSPVKAKTRRKRSVKTMATRKRTVKRRTVPKRTVKRRTAKRRVSNKVMDIQSILINGGIAGAGAFTALWLSNKVNEAMGEYTQGKPALRNLVALAVAVGGSMLGYKYLDNEKATSLSHGMVAGIALLALKTSFGLNIGLAGDIYENPVSNYTLAGGGVGLLEGESSSFGLLEGSRFNTEFSELSEYM